MTCIIGTRLDYSAMNEALDRNVSHINQKFSKTLRKVAMDKGIKQTEQGKRLEFYIVTDEEFSQFSNEGNDMLLKLAGKPPVRALISIDYDKMSENLDAVNNKQEYQGGMKYDVHQRYLLELREAMADAVHKIGNDENTRKKADKVGENPYKVGDYIYNSICKTLDGETGEQEFHWFANMRVVKSGKRFIEVEYAGLTGERLWSNTESAVECFNDVVTWDMERCKWSGDPHGHFVPEASNPHAITWHHHEKKIQWNKITGTKLENIGNEQYGRKCRIHGVGYKYNYEGCRD